MDTRLLGVLMQRFHLGAVGSILLTGALVAQEPAAPSPETSGARPQVKATRISDPIDVDGVLDEGVWERAEVGTGFVQREPDPGEPATERTEVRVVYNQSTLYVGILAFHSQPETIVAEELQRDGALFRDDSILVLLDTYDDDRNAYFFETNANGARTDALVTDEGRDFNVQWDGIWASAAQRTPEGWSLELAIPFSTLRFDPDNTTWGLNVRRLIRHKNEEVFWSPIPLEANLFRVSMAGDLTGMEGVEPGLNLRVKPFVVGTDSDFQTTVVPEAEEDLDVGADLKWGLTRNLTLDLTYNTDFAETEVDSQRVNLTRFSLFFPEKREFFLENAGIFEFGFGSPVGAPLLKPFFSRRIGISPFGTEVPMDWGGRLTGRVGKWNLGLLNAQTERADLGGGAVVPRDNWGVARVSRNVGQRSKVGMIFTNRDSQGGGYNRVYGLDANFNPTRRLNLSSFITQSDDSDETGSDDWAAGVRSAWQGAIWSWGVDALQIGDDYNPEAGFLLRRGIRRYTPRFTFSPRPEKGIVRNYIYGATLDVFTDLDDRTESVLASGDLFGVRLQSEDEAVLFAQHRYERLEGPFRLAPGVVVPPDSYEFSAAGVRFATNSSRPLALNGAVLGGEFFSGDILDSVVNLGWRPNRHFRSDTTFVYTDVELPEGAFDFYLVRERLGVALTPNLSTNAFVQYNDFAELLSLNLRFNWIYRPGADLFIVFNQNWGAPGLDDLTAEDRALIIKFTYLHEF